MPDLDAATHRALADRLSADTWSLLEATGRSIGDEDRMIHSAHAAVWHWLQVGGAAEAARGESQLARVYCALGRPEAALWHAVRAAEMAQEVDAGAHPTLAASTYAGLARAHALAGHRQEAVRWHERALHELAALPQGQDDAAVRADLATTLEATRPQGE